MELTDEVDRISAAWSVDDHGHRRARVAELRVILEELWHCPDADARDLRCLVRRMIDSVEHE